MEDTVALDRKTFCTEYRATAAKPCSKSTRQLKVKQVYIKNRFKTPKGKWHRRKDANPKSTIKSTYRERFLRKPKLY